MANPTNPSIDIISRQNGAVISHVASNQQVVALNELSIVRIHGTPAMVASYERQGSDLILHMKDGSTVRYQRFFTTDAEGNYSELVFDDGVNPPVQATFPAAMGATLGGDALLVPEFTSIDSVAGLALGSSASSAGLLAGALGFLAIAGGIGIAASQSNSHSSSGGNPLNSSDVSVNPTSGGTTAGRSATVVLNTTKPTLTISPVADDGIINGAEQKVSQTLSGETTHVEAGQTVFITLNNKTYSATVGADGKWSTQIPASDLAMIANGTTQLHATVKNVAGNSGSADSAITVDNTQAGLGVNPVAGDNLINLAESALGITVSGTSTGQPLSTQVTVTLNNVPYTGTTDSDGNWSVTIPSGDLTPLPDGPITLNVQAPGVTDVNIPLGIYIHDVPAATINTPFGDGTLNGAEANSDQTITGSTGASGAGQTVTVSFNGVTYHPTVALNGSWSLILPTATLQALPDGTWDVTVTAKDAAGNVSSLTDQVEVLTHNLPHPTLTLPFGDGTLNHAEALLGQTLTGSTGATGSGQSVVISIDGNVIQTVTAGTDGSWSLPLLTALLTGLTSGPHTIGVTVTDAMGNSNASSLNFDSFLTPPLPTISTLPFGAELNLVEASTDQTLTGTTGLLDMPQGVTVTLNGKQYTADVDTVTGIWTLIVPTADLKLIPDGSQSIKVDVLDGGGNSGSSSLTIGVVTHDLPTVTVDTPPFGLVLDFASSKIPQILTGSTTHMATGSQVNITFGSLNLTATVGSDGKWATTVSSAQLGSLTSGNAAITATVTDSAGNTGQTINPIDVNVNIVAPLVVLTIDPIETSNIINVLNDPLAITIGGKVTNTTSGAVKLTFSGGIGEQSAVVDVDGSWSVTLPKIDLPDGNYQVTAELVGGASTASETVELLVDRTPPTLTVLPFAVDNSLNALESKLPQLLSGTASLSDIGRTVTVTLNGKTYSALIEVGGLWSVSIPAADLQGLPQGDNPLTVSLTDLAGNSITQTPTIHVDTLPALITLDASALVLNSNINGSELLGTALGAEGQTLTLTLDGLTLDTQVGSDGKWSIKVLPGQLTGIADGPLVAGLSVTDTAGNASSINATVNVALNPGLAVTVDPLFNGGYLNAVGATLDQVLSGTTANAGLGAKVNLTLNGVPLSADVGANGKWTLTLPAAQLALLGDGPLALDVTVTDANNNVVKVDTAPVLNVLTHTLPLVTLNPIFGDGILNANDLLSPQIISGTVKNLPSGATVTLKLGTLTLTPTLDSNGAFSVTLDSTALSSLLAGSFSVTASVTDSAGNSNTATSPLQVDEALPVITLNPIFGDGLLNATDALLPQTISGHSTFSEGATLNVTLGDLALSTTVEADGSWSIEVPPLTLAGLLDGDFIVHASLTNAAGHSAAATASVSIGLNLPTLTVTPFFASDQYLSGAESTAAQVISGTSTHAAGLEINVTVGGAALSTTIGSDGSWSVPIPPSALTGLLDGPAQIGVSVTDAVGNHTEINTGFTVKTHALPLLGVDVLGNIGNLLLLPTNGLVISGTSLNVLPNTKIKVELLGQSLEGIVDSSGHWSVKFFGAFLSGLNLLTTQVAVELTDEAGNYKRISVGLVSGLQLSSASSDMQSDGPMEVNNSDTPHAASVITPVALSSSEPIDSTLTTPVTEGGYRIGGVTLNLADGTVMSGDALTGSSGNDIFTVNALNFIHLDGGLGVDTLLLSGSHQALDLTRLGLKVEHIDIIDLGKSGTNSITLDLHEALTLTDKPQDDLLIKGAQGGQVTLSNTPEGVWSSVDQRSVDGQTFDVYHNASLESSNTLGDVLIQQGLQVHLV